MRKTLYASLLACLLLLTTVSAQQFEWATNSDGTFNIRANGVVTDPDGNTIVVGAFMNILDLDPGPGVYNVVSPGTQYSSFIQKLDSNGAFVWGRSVRTYAGGNSNFARDVETDAAGNIYVMGDADGFSDFNVGPGTDSLGIPNNGTFVLRLSAAGDYLGAGLLNNALSNVERFALLGLDADANLYIGGYLAASVDFDLGPGSYNLTSNGSDDIYFAKYDSTLALQWAHTIGTTGQEQVTSLDVQASGLYIGGVFGPTVDFDPGPATVPLTNNSGFQHLFVAHYSFNGALEWAQALASNQAYHLQALAADDLGNVAVCGKFMGTMDLDPGPAVQSVTSAGNYDSFIVSLDPSGNLTWAHAYSNPDLDWIRDVDRDATGASYLALTYMGTMDADPGQGSTIFTGAPVGTEESVIIKFDGNGNLVWAHQLGDAAGLTILTRVHVGARGSIAAIGPILQTVDFDPSVTSAYNLTQYGGQDYFTLLWSQDYCSNFVVHIDTVHAITCAGQIGYLGGSVVSGTPPYAYGWNTTPPTLDSIATTFVPGIYALTATDAAGCEASLSALIGGPTALNGFDLQANMIAWQFRANLATRMTIDANNYGCSPLTGGQLKLAMDPRVHFVSATTAPTSIVGDTLKWTMPTLHVDSAHFVVDVYVLTDTTAHMGDSLNFATILTPIVGDQQPGDNSRIVYSYPVLAAYDPNVKSVFPVGVCDEHYVLRNTPLTYTIQFQNTGTAEALEVAILDTLDGNLDIGTLSIKATSHNMITEVLPPSNVLRFAFHDIHLPDSGADEPGSHGYVVYEIQHLGNIVSGLEIRNGSAIYFDFNPPVITNVVMNTIVDQIPACAVGVENIDAADPLQVFPNPATAAVQLRALDALGDVRVVNMLGQVMWAADGILTKALEIDVRDWPRGIYWIQAQGVTHGLLLE